MDLLFDCHAAALIHEGVGITFHEEGRHEVFEHRAAPGKQTARTVELRQWTGEIKPVILRHIAACDGDQAGDARFRSHQVVVIGIELTGLNVVANVKDMPLRIVQEAKGHGLDEGIRPAKRATE